MNLRGSSSQQAVEFRLCVSHEQVPMTGSFLIHLAAEAGDGQAGGQRWQDACQPDVIDCTAPHWARRENTNGA